MRFVSIYIPSYARQTRPAHEFWRKYWHLLPLVLAIHFLVFSLLSSKPLSKIQSNDDLIIDLNTPVEIPKRAVEKNTLPLAEEKKSEASPKAESRKPVARVQPIEAPPASENTPLVKFNEEVIKPIKPIKADPVPEKPAVVVTVKPEEKKVQVQSDTSIQVQADVKQAEPKPAEVIAPALPALVDKKNKDKDAPEVAQPSKGAGSSASASSDTAKSSASSSSNPAASGSPGGSQTGVQSGNKSTATNNEMQALISGGKPMAAGSSSGTADADYKSEGLRNAQPRYPIYARKMRQEGVVIVSAEVLTDGNATDVRMAISSGIKLLDEAAIETVKQWQFTPAKKDGIPYVQRLRIPITFSLNSR